MVKIEEYILFPQTQRQEHLKLNEPCIERGGYSANLKGLLAHILNTTIPENGKIHVCHACHNGACSHPYHIYWGTPRENRLDAIANGAKSIWECLVEKHGLEEAKRLTSVWARMVKKYGREGAHKVQKESRAKQEINIKYKRTSETRQLMSSLKQGEKNNQFGKIWIYNLTDKVSKVIEKKVLHQYLSAGWLVGRKIKF